MNNTPAVGVVAAVGVLGEGIDDEEVEEVVGRDQVHPTGILQRKVFPVKVFQTHPMNPP